MFKSFIVFSSLFILSASAVQSMDNLGIIADIDPQDQAKISKTISTTSATQLFKQQAGNNIFWLDRPQCNTYHITLDILQTAGNAFGQQEVDQLEGILNNYKRFSKKLNGNGSNGKHYMGNGYELVLFAHDGNQHNEFTSKNIQTLTQTMPQVGYANLVLRLGTNGELRDDWLEVRNNILPRPQHAAVFKRANNHEIKTHITIANFFKYEAKDYHINNGKVEDKKNPGKKIFNTPYKGAEVNLLVNAFQEVNKGFQSINGIKIDRLLISTKNNGTTQTLKTVMF